MTLSDGPKLFNDYLLSKKLKSSRQRIIILETFLKSNKHITVDELYRLVEKRLPTIGYATIYRTIRIFRECGICKELKIEDKATRYEPLYGHEHHDHMICLRCGKLIEIYNDEIERQQVQIAKENNYVLKSHKLELYGFCEKCRVS